MTDTNIIDKSMRSVFVGNIPYEATEEKLKDIFSEVGPVLSFKLVFDRETGKPKGYGFCEYKDQETALSAMRNLNGFEIGGRSLRVDNACTEKSRLEMQSLLAGPPVDNTYGEPVESDKAPEAISKAVASLPPEQMFELMKQMKLCIQNNPAEGRQMLLQNPQLAYALLQAQVVMRIVDPQVAITMLHKVNPPSNTQPSPIEPRPVAPVVAVVQPRPDPPAMVLPPRPTPAQPAVPAVITGQDLDLRNLGAVRPPAPIGSDQDMRMPPSQPMVPPVPQPEVQSRDPRAGGYSRDPRAGGMASAAGAMAANIRGAVVRPGMAPVSSINNATPMAPTANVPPRGVSFPAGQAAQIPSAVPSAIPSSASDQEKAALIMQVLQLSDDQIAMLPPEQRQSILVLKEQIAKSQQR